MQNQPPTGVMTVRANLMAQLLNGFSKIHEPYALNIVIDKRDFAEVGLSEQTDYAG